ncbi:MAG: excinuclease ABC subunit UvrA [Leptolyngbya sp. PLA3]|nr:MAG: excinuclease ABC subunit UvrA [Cyanobacteria bacterium CYA]MCE7969429.1 excinuclease ABC subunit UvrA [Leptolyngbya sp. PL-A3]
MPEPKPYQRSKAHDDRSIRVRGAREHNLKNIDVEIPRDQLVVITGLSGSGKSSLVFDTIFAEGQRKYMESLSAYARQFLDQLKKPDVEEVEGIPPTIAIEQRSSAHNPRSTVATTIEIYDYLRLLFARCGTPRSWAATKTKKDGTIVERSGRLIEASTSTQIVDTLMGMAEGTRLMVLAPVVRDRKGFHKDVLDDLFKQGWTRARVNRDVIDLREALKSGNENPLNLHRHKKHTIETVVDRIAINADARQRLAESVDAALKLAQGTVIISVEGGGPGVLPGSDASGRRDARSTGSWTDQTFSTNFADPENPEVALEEVSPRLFSFNSPWGACPACHGLGAILEFDEALVVPNEDLPILKGAIAPWKKNGPGGMIYPSYLRRFCRNYNVQGSTTIGSLDREIRRILLHGATPADEEHYGAVWPGVLPMLHSWFEKTESTWVKDHLHEFQTEKVCPACNGDRLRIEALHVLIESGHRAEKERAFSPTVIGRPKHDGSMLNISELSRLNINDAIAFIEQLKLSQEHRQISEPILREVMNRLRFLTSVGLEYLSLDRRTATLSGGEAQRIRLATQVGSGLVGACYVLDEPTIGLHQRDNDRLIRTLRHLTDIGNSVLVVEHDEDMIRSGDHVIDVGPGPGVHGGRIVAQGTVAQICDTPTSITGDYLAGRRTIDIPAKRRALSEKKALTIRGARQNNLKSIDVAIPLGGFICVTGVSGSGKSTLVNDILLQAVRKHLLGTRANPGQHARITGLQHVDRIIEVDQSPIGRTPRSNPATYTGIFDDIRKVFAQTKEAKIRAYQPGRFSFNVPARSGGGRCEACQGQGLKKIEMHFLPDVFVECEVCRGKRYNRETLDVTYRGRSIADVLDMTVETACEFFENHPRILRFAQCLRDVGLDYITLGQPSTTLSGGEAQRIKLATELGKGVRYDGTPSPEHTLYILDEPTTGLHFEDIRKLLEVLDRLAGAGNTLVVIEHNLDVIKCADWIIDLGPEGGDKGGTVVASGTPEQIARTRGSYTGQYLKTMLK